MLKVLGIGSGVYVKNRKLPGKGTCFDKGQSKVVKPASYHN